MLSEILETKNSIKNELDDPVKITKKLLENSATPTKKKLKNYSKNEALNKVLNETVGGIPSETKGGEPNTMTDLNGNAVNVDELPDHLSNALTRNYSDVLNLVDKKRGKIK